MNIVKTSALLVLMALTTTFQTEGKDKKGKKEPAERTVAARTEAAVAPTAATAVVPTALPPQEEAPSVLITPEEKRVIRKCIAGDATTTPRGQTYTRPRPLDRAEPSALPVGWQKKAKRGEVMPEAFLNECRPLPREISAKLPAAPRGTILVALDGKVVRLMAATREILDIFDPSR